MGKVEIARNKHNFHTMFSTHSDDFILIYPYFDIISLFAVEFEEPKVGISGKGLRREKYF